MAISDGVTLVVLNHAEPECDQTVSALRTALWNRRLFARIVVSHDPDGRGIGWAARQGLARVETPWVIFVMADGSEDPECVVTMVDACTAAVDAVWGDRWDRGAVTGYPRLKRLINRAGNALIGGLLRSGYTDWTDMAKGYRVARLRQIAWSDDFRCEIEMPLRYRWQIGGCWMRVAYVPMRWTERTAGKSSYKLSRAGVMLWTLWTVWREYQ